MPVFYIILITICTSGQIAIFIKKHIEKNRDKNVQMALAITLQLVKDQIQNGDQNPNENLVQNPNQDPNQNPHQKPNHDSNHDTNHDLNHDSNQVQVVKPMIANNKRINDYLCTNKKLLLFLIYVATLACFANLLQWLILYESSLDEEEQTLIKYFFLRLLVNFFVPLAMYVQNDKLFRHVKDEIFA